MLDPARPEPIVVGVDGSAESCHAVGWAARESVRAGRRLRIVHAFIWPMFKVSVGPSEAGAGGLRADAERTLAEAYDLARAAAPEVVASTELISGGAAAVLVGQSREAAYLVVGNRGLTGFTGLLLGSVALQLAQYAACPVIVTRPAHNERRTGRVVLGADGSDVANRALQFAAAEVVERQGHLHVLHVCKGAPDAAAQAILDTAVTRARELSQGRPVTGKVVQGHPGQVLIDASDEADLVVVGTRGNGGFRGMLLGSVSQATLHHSRCPVAAVRRRQEIPAL